MPNRRALNHACVFGSVNVLFRLLEPTASSRASSRRKSLFVVFTEISWLIFPRLQWSIKSLWFAHFLQSSKVAHARYWPTESRRPDRRDLTTAFRCTIASKLFVCLMTSPAKRQGVKKLSTDSFSCSSPRKSFEAFLKLTRLCTWETVSNRAVNHARVFKAVNGLRFSRTAPKLTASNHSHTRRKSLFCRLKINFIAWNFGRLHTNIKNAWDSWSKLVVDVKNRVPRETINLGTAY